MNGAWTIFLLLAFMIAAIVISVVVAEHIDLRQERSHSATGWRLIPTLLITVAVVMLLVLFSWLAVLIGGINRP